MGDVHTLVWSLTSERVQQRTHMDIPELDAAVMTATGEDHPIGTERNGPDTISVSLERVERCAGCHVP